MKAINIKWKAYVEVNERIKEFRNNEKYKWYTLTSDIISIENWVCIIRAEIKDWENRLIANWYAYEKEGSSFINKTSYIENCETSAWWRALGNLWIWIDTSIATADEVLNAVKQQTTDKWLNYEDFKNIVEAWNTTEEQIASIIKEDWYKLSSFAKWAVRHYCETWELDKNLFFKQPK